MNLIKTSLFSGLSVLIKILTLLGINKVLAVYVGPSGYAAIGQLQNVIQIITGVATGTLSNGVTKLTAEKEGDTDDQVRVWQTAGVVAIFCALTISLIVIFCRDTISFYALGSSEYSNVLLFFAFTLIFFVLNALLLAILNGKREVRRYVAANIVGSIISVIFVSILTINYGLEGAMLALVTFQSVSFFGTAYICSKCEWFSFSYLIGDLDVKILKQLAIFLLMAVSSAILAPFVLILIRDHLIKSIGISAAGYWEAIWRLSSAYLMVVTTTLSVYYLPVLSKLKDKSEIRNEIINGSKIIIPVVVIISFLVYLLRDYIILLLFSREFLPAEELMAWQMIGDTIKIASWLMSFLMLAKSMLKTFIVSQVLSHFLFYIFTYLLTNKYGLIGVSYAHAINFLVYFFFIYFFVYKKVVKT